MMNKLYNGRIHSILLACALTAGIGLSGATEAALAFSQLPVNGNDAFPSISAEQAADDFSLASNGMVNGLTWWGSYASDPAGLPADLFRVSIFQDDGAGNPAITPFITLTDAVTRTPTGLLDATSDPVYQYDLSSSFALTGGTLYYLSVVNEFDVNDPNANWFWLLSDSSGSNYYRVATNEPWEKYTTGNLAFNINVATAVPEPANLWLFLMGSVLLGFVVKVRKA